MTDPRTKKDPTGGGRMRQAESGAAAVRPEAAPLSAEDAAALDMHTPTVARVHDFLLGGVESYEVDRALGRSLASAAPGLTSDLMACRAYEARMLRRFADDGISQVLVLGCGIPQGPVLVQDVIQQVHPDSYQVLLVDRDPLVTAHTRVLIEDPHHVGVSRCDLAHTRDLVDELARCRLRRDRPVLVLMHHVLEWLPDDAAARLMDTVRAWLPSGSAISLIHALDGDGPAEMARVYQAAGLAFRPRSEQDIKTLRDPFVPRSGLVRDVAPASVRLPRGHHISLSSHPGAIRA
ncbi:SAM-dependent methyltransferase [Streptomyces goshikiensis]|uniref:SAM-dependent methyltransferase n=1 Tax=Streptomyces goshikiensis TaxID=1942 RepID=UPI0036A49586